MSTKVMFNIEKERNQLKNDLNKFAGKQTVKDEFLATKVRA